jgi:hypothetical protein
VELLKSGLDKGNDLWPKLKPIFTSCLENKDINVRLLLVDLYDNAKDLAPKMEELLAVKWKIAGNPKFTQSQKAEIIRDRIRAETRAAKLSPGDRKKRLQELLNKSPLSAGKQKGQPPPNALRDTESLAQVSTMASILFNKDAEMDRFDQFSAQILGSEQDQAAKANKPKAKAPKSNEDDNVLEDVDAGNKWDSKLYRLTENDLTDARRGTYYKKFTVFLRAGEKYVISMQSDDFQPWLRLESAAKEKLNEHKYNKNNFTFYPTTDGDYVLVATSMKKKAEGAFKLHIERPKPEPQPGLAFQGFPIARNPLLAPRNIPAQNLPPRNSTPRKTPRRKTTPDANKDEPEALALDASVLADLGKEKIDIRSAAFKNLTSRLPDDLSYNQAKKIANYLLPTDWEPTEDELEFIMRQLPALARFPYLLVALADEIANEGKKFNQARVVPIIGGLLQQKNLSLAPDEDWRKAFRTLLLQRAVRLQNAQERRGPAASNDADAAAEHLRDLYKEQARAFGLDDSEFSEQTPVTAVLEQLIKNVAVAAAQQKSDPEEKAYLEKIDRHLTAARFVAENDLELTVLLQRIWIKVLILAMPEQKPATKNKMKTVAKDLDKKDIEAVNLLDQLRLGEENILRVWALAHDLKLQ